MANMNARSNIWSSDQQNRQIFNWGSILSEWNDSLTMHPYVQTVIDNLKATSDPNSDYNFPLSHFSKFLNWERAGLTWFLYEVVTMRYIWGESRLDYVAELIDMDEIELDEGFPFFPGSPRNYRTVRRFLHDSLNAEELEYLDMMPSLITHQDDVIMESAPATPSRRPTVAEEPRAPLIVRLHPDVVRDTSTPSYGQIEINVLRKNSKKDNVIYITKQHKLFDEHYTIKYSDKQDSYVTSTKDVTREGVLNYLSTVLRLLAVDTQPFESVQLTVPNAPTVMLPIDMDSYSRTLFYDAVESVMDNWPVRLL